MAITITNANLAITNPQLVPLTSRKYSTSYTAVPNVKLPEDMLSTLTKIYQAMTGAELPLDGCTIAVSSEAGYFKRLYTPKVYAEAGGSCYVKWGEERVPLTVANGKLEPTHQEPGYKVAIKLTTANPSARGEDPAIEVKVTDVAAKQVYSAHFALAVSDWNGYSAGDYETVLDTDPDSFLALLVAEYTGGGGKKGGGGGGVQIEGDVTSTKAIRAEAFPNGQNYDLLVTVTGYKLVNAGGRPTAILQCEPIEDEGVNSAVPCTAAKFGLWADPSVRPMLLSSPEITAAKPATLVVPVGAGARARLLVDSAALASTPGGLQLDF